MTYNFLKISVSALALSVMAGSALAGGYGRGSANIDTLFDEGTSVSSSVGVTSPTRSMSSVNGVATSGATAVDYAETYATFGASVAFNVAGGVRCAGSFANPYGADANYGMSRILADVNGAPNTGPNTTNNSLSSSEFGLTCSYGAAVGPGNAFVFGGLFYQSLDYVENRGVATSATTFLNVANISMNDASLGYRMGVGYTIPEVALKASLVYRSEVNHRMEGVQSITGLGAFNIFANASTPQSVKLSLQSGIAEGWLAFASVEWTDWSVIQRIPVLLTATGTPAPGQPAIDAYFSDGWTVNAGVGHKFNDLFSGSFSVTWDKGVSTAFAGANRSTFTDTWTFALGGAFTPNATSSFRAGLAYSLLSGGSETGLGGGATVITNSSSALSAGVSGNFKF